MRALLKVRNWLSEKGYDGVLLGRRDNYTWISGGAKNHVLSSEETGVAYYVIRKDSVQLIADSSDLARMTKEQNPLNAEGILVPWYESMDEYIREKTRGKNYVSDTGIGGTVNVQEELCELRMNLSDSEVEKYREIGLLCANLVEGVCRDARPGDTEEKIACMLKCRCLENGVSPDCVLVGADERILDFRHPMPTDKKIEKSLMVVLGGEKYGLNISMTRMVFFTPVSAIIRERYDKTAYIFACMQNMMADGKSYCEYFKNVEKLYNEAGYGGEWKMHHQGGPTGYACREYVVTPDMDKVMHAGCAYAWNPTIQGTKCEETTYLGKNGVEIFTETSQWPRKKIDTPFGKFDVADILEVW
ncbi:MAG: M24 family metallopeptidase [Lachnospiraceae bacterium]